MKKSKRKNRKIRKKILKDKDKRGFIKRHPYVSSVVGTLSLIGFGYFLEPYIFIPKTEKLKVVQTDEKISFIDAKNNSELRQGYIGNIIDEYGLVDGLREIRYEPGVVGLSKGKNVFSVMRTHFIVPAQYQGSDLETEILVYTGAFLSVQSENEFLSLLLDHEYRHTDQIRGRVKLRFSSKEEYDSLALEISDRLFEVHGNLFNLFGELDAYSAQIDSFYKRALSEKFRRGIISRYNYYVDLLDEKEETPLVEYLKKNFKRKPKF